MKLRRTRRSRGGGGQRARVRGGKASALTPNRNQSRPTRSLAHGHPVSSAPHLLVRCWALLEARRPWKRGGVGELSQGQHLPRDRHAIDDPGWITLYAGAAT